MNKRPQATAVGLSRLLFFSSLPSSPPTPFPPPSPYRQKHSKTRFSSFYSFVRPFGASARVCVWTDDYRRLVQETQNNKSKRNGEIMIGHKYIWMNYAHVLVTRICSKRQLNFFRSYALENESGISAKPECKNSFKWVSLVHCQMFVSYNGQELSKFDILISIAVKMWFNGE